MSVYIKGMGMPKNCLECDWCAHTIPADNYICYRLNRAVIGVAKEDVNETVNACCPIVPVPPHGRMGDLDALVERIDGILDCNDMVFRPNDKICKIPEDCKGCKWAQTKDCIQRMVENAPTIIPAEEEN